MTGMRGLSVLELAEPNLAIQYLGTALHRGELALLLGAGVSHASGLPGWQALVEGCESETGVTASPGGRSTQELMDAMGSLSRSYLATGRTVEEFRELIRRHLYPQTYLDEGTYPDDQMQNLMLIALGALLMPSSRGSIREVVTMNFDDLLEWYLALHGFTTQSVTNLPCVLRSETDSTIYHAHGFIPLTGVTGPTDWMVLTYREFVARIAGTSGLSWPRFLTNLLSTKRLLTVGTSMSDVDLHVHLEQANSERSDDDPAGFVVNDSFSSAEAAALRDMRLVPVALTSHAAVPHFLLDICRFAAKLR